MSSIITNKIVLPEDFFTYDFPPSAEESYLLKDLRRVLNWRNLSREDITDYTHTIRSKYFDKSVILKNDKKLERLANHAKENSWFVLNLTAYDFDKEYRDKSLAWAQQGYYANTNGDNVLIDWSVFGFINDNRIRNLEIWFNSDIHWFSNSLSFNLENLVITNKNKTVSIMWDNKRYQCFPNMTKIFIDCKTLCFNYKNNFKDWMNLREFGSSAERVEIGINGFRNIERIYLPNVKKLRLVDELWDLQLENNLKIVLPVDCDITFRHKKRVLWDVPIKWILNKKEISNKKTIEVDAKKLLKIHWYNKTIRKLKKRNKKTKN